MAQDSNLTRKLRLAESKISSFWRGHLPQVVHQSLLHVPTSAPVLVCQHRLYVINNDGIAAEIHPEGSFSSFSIFGDNVVLNLKRGISILPLFTKEPIESRVFQSFFGDSVNEVASGRDWVLAVTDDPRATDSGDVALGFKMSKDHAERRSFELPLGYNWRLTDYGDRAIYWARGAKRLFIVRWPGIQPIELSEPIRLNNSFFDCDSSDRVFIRDEVGYRILSE